MPNPNTGAVDPALEPERMPKKDDPSPKNTPSVPDDKYGNRDTKEREGGRENQEMTRKTRSAKNRPEEGQATHART